MSSIEIECEQKELAYTNIRQCDGFVLLTTKDDDDYTACLHHIRSDARLQMASALIRAALLLIPDAKTPDQQAEVLLAILATSTFSDTIRKQSTH